MHRGLTREAEATSITSQALPFESGHGRKALRSRYDLNPTRRTEPEPAADVSMVDAGVQNCVQQSLTVGSVDDYGSVLYLETAGAPLALRLYEVMHPYTLRRILSALCEKTVCDNPGSVCVVGRQIPLQDLVQEPLLDLANPRAGGHRIATHQVVTRERALHLLHLL